MAIYDDRDRRAERDTREDASRGDSFLFTAVVVALVVVAVVLLGLTLYRF